MTKNSLLIALGYKPAPATVMAALMQPELRRLAQTDLEPKPTIAPNFRKTGKTRPFFFPERRNLR